MRMDIDTGSLIDTLSATPSALAHLVAEVTEARLDWSEAAEGWSPRTILAHLRDDEYLCMRAALERMLAFDNPEIGFIEGDDWEPNRNRTRDRKELLLADFALQRQATLGILRLIRPEDWERRGHSPQGEISIAGFVEQWARHDSAHIEQLETALGESLADVVARRARPDA